MADVDRVVYTETNSQDDVDAGDDVDSDIPEVEEADDICKTECDHEDDHETDLDIAEEEEGDADHAGY